MASSLVSCLGQFKEQEKLWLRFQDGNKDEGYISEEEEDWGDKSPRTPHHYNSLTVGCAMSCMWFLLLAEVNPFENYTRSFQISFVFFSCVTQNMASSLVSCLGQLEEQEKTMVERTRRLLDAVNAIKDRTIRRCLRCPGDWNI